jgi:hypothetical protein
MTPLATATASALGSASSMVTTFADRKMTSAEGPAGGPAVAPGDAGTLA